MFKLKKRERKRKHQVEETEKPKTEDPKPEKPKPEKPKPEKTESSGDSAANQEFENPPQKNNDIIEYVEIIEDAFPTYFHIGRWAKDCLFSGYVFGNLFFECKTEPSEDCVLNSFWSGKFDMSTILGGVGVTENFGMLRISQYIRSDGSISTCGLRNETEESLWKAILRATYPNTGDGLMLDLNAAVHVPPFRVDVIVPLLKEPKCKGYVLLHSSNFIVGYRTVYDFDNREFDLHNIFLGYVNENTEVGLKLENRTLRGSIFRRLGENWAFALKGDIHNSESQKITFGGQYALNENSLLKAKVQIHGLVEAAYQIQINDNVRTSISCGFEPNAPLRGDHKLGASIIFEE